MTDEPKQPQEPDEPESPDDDPKVIKSTTWKGESSVQEDESEKKGE